MSLGTEENDLVTRDNGKFVDIAAERGAPRSMRAEASRLYKMACDVFIIENGSFTVAIEFRVP
jgi:hypothetical protein